MKKEFVQVYGYCVEGGVAGEIHRWGPTTYIRLSDIRRVAVYTTFDQLAPEGVCSIFQTHFGKQKHMEPFWDKFRYTLGDYSGFSPTCGQTKHGVHICMCDFSMVLPLVEVWTKTGKYFVAGDDRFRFVVVERK